jgi:translation initiation factor IF-2
MALGKKRVYEIARELGISAKEFMEALGEMGMPGLRAVNAVEEEEAEVLRELFREHKGALAPAPPLELPKGQPRPPVVAVLGHIDHGKTTLLDAIRKTHVTQEEAGGITQSIGAYQAMVDGRPITFIDTPGHKAFTAMRARGGQAADIAILVVAADDGVMAQTLEALDHIKAAKTPMIVAINKIDKPGTSPEKVMQGLAQLGYTPEEWGGDTIFVAVSALTGQGVEDLLEMILLLADMGDIRGDPGGELEATVIESRLDLTRGPMATVIVKNGTLRVRDIVVVGDAFGRIRALLDHQGRQIKEAGPGTPVQIVGLSHVPPAGEVVERVEKSQAKALVEERRRELGARRTARPLATFEGLLAEKKRLAMVLKAESIGALDAARLELGTIEVEGAEIEVLHAGVGSISESDVLLASSVEGPQPLVVGFGVKVDPRAARVAEERGVPVRIYNIIYDLTQDIKAATQRLLGPQLVPVKVGEAEVLRVFQIDGVGKVAGCVVRSGRVVRGAQVRVLRGDEEVFTGEIASLRRFAQDVGEVGAGRECGVRIRDFDLVQAGDVLWIYTLEEVPA